MSTDQRLYQAGTNVVGIIDRLAPILPPPFCSVAEAGTVLAAAGLAAWNAWQHKAIKNLQNGQGIAIAAKSVSDAHAAGVIAGLAAARSNPTLLAQTPPQPPPQPEPQPCAQPCALCVGQPLAQPAALPGNNPP